MSTAGPVLVRTYTNNHARITGIAISSPTALALAPPPPLPAISAYSFASILRAADCPDLQQALDGIAEICAKNRMSLADEYASHLPPLGEITAANASAPLASRPHLQRPGLGGRVLTAVPEGGSSSSEGSRRSGKSKGKGRLFTFQRPQAVEASSRKTIKIGSMGRTVPVGSTTAMAANLSWPAESAEDSNPMHRPQVSKRRTSEAEVSLRKLLDSTT